VWVKNILKYLFVLFGSFLAFLLFFFLSLYFNWFGVPLSSGDILEVNNRTLPLNEGSNLNTKKILFGDLHVHSSFSLDAYLGNLPLLQGEGAHPISDACDYARFCSNIDFWSINDHAAFLTSREWKETINEIQQCNLISKNIDDSSVVSFLGWEWTQRSTDPVNHYGHKNIVLKSIDLEDIPRRPIAANLAEEFPLDSVGLILQASALLEDFKNRKMIFDLRYKQIELKNRKKCSSNKDTKSLPRDCLEIALTPQALFTKLDAIDTEVLVIPHGTAWGNTAPPLASWTYQLSPDQNNNKYQRLIEVFSGHGNSEEYRSWRSMNLNPDSSLDCPSPVLSYLPSCFQAGEIIKNRCLFSAGSEEECNFRAIQARENYILSNPLGHLSVPNQSPEEWLDSGQCKDCYLPAFNYRPGLSVQHALALTDFSQEEPFRFRFGFIGSSDNHQAKAGNGYKEIFRLGNSDARGPLNEESRIAMDRRSKEQSIPNSRLVDSNAILASGAYPRESERGSTFFLTGGLVAVHAENRDRDSIWDSLNRREVYATSGDRILLWFDLVTSQDKIYPMGSELESSTNPTFKVKALGAFKQKSGCAGNEIIYPEISNRIENLCKGECYNPTDKRKLISRIEVVRIRPQIYPGESIESLIQDPWKVIPCEDEGGGCNIEFQDLQFENGTREVVYYVRAIQEPSKAINANGINCDLDSEGNCIKTNLCYGDYRGREMGDCLAESEERAWSSPIYVDFNSSDFLP